ncbi:MAG: hypothetical protein AMXMBFR64_56910 [Myxococcales bacterium]
MKERPRESRLRGLGWLLGRVPIALREDRCTRAISPMSTCTRCVGACTRGAIELKPQRSKSVPAFMPSCDECGECARECPNSAIILPGKSSTSRRDLLAGWLVPRARIRPARAAWVLSRGGCDGCGVCEKLCPVGALDGVTRASWSEVASSACTGCGLCVDVCVLKAIAVRAEADEFTQTAS